MRYHVFYINLIKLTITTDKLINIYNNCGINDLLTEDACKNLSYISRVSSARCKYLINHYASVILELFLYQHHWHLSWLRSYGMKDMNTTSIFDEGPH